MRFIYFCWLMFGIFSFLNAQINYTAQDQVPPFQGDFGYGSNMGYYPPWTDEELADFAAGNSAKGIPGVGVNTLRPALFEWFLEQWGYDIRLDAFAHYRDLGIRDVVCFIGYPSEEHRGTDEFCPGSQTAVFKNLYTDIWDDGANGTPVNDENYYALYLYKMVSLYKDYVKIWEVWNEPDQDFSGNGWKPADMEGNWWLNNPAPCDYTLKAPIFYYVRMLRIAYEVIKYIDPEAYIAVGGLGFPSFLDAILRNTDNPTDGSVNTDYPLDGGAYFDVMSYHIYPHLDESMREWNNAANDFDYFRHSDAAADGIITKKQSFKSEYDQKGYDGQTYPEKVWIITESNIPRKAFEEYIGSDAAQRNFVLKSLVACQMNDIAQFHIYSLSETYDYTIASNGFQNMGLYEKIENKGLSSIIPTESGIAYKTMSDFLPTCQYDPQQTAALQLPNTIQGAAFLQPNGEYRYILWARTQSDQSEQAQAQYNFPTSFAIESLLMRHWDYSQTSNITNIQSSSIWLSGDPQFIIPQKSGSNPPTSTVDQIRAPSPQVSPNPFQDQLFIHWEKPIGSSYQLRWYNSLGQIISQQTQRTNAPHQVISIPSGLSQGFYWLQIEDENGHLFSFALTKQ